MSCPRPAWMCNCSSDADVEGNAAEPGQSLLEQRTTEFTLPNGLHFIVLERHNAPVLSCHTYANVGAFEEVDGQTGGVFDSVEEHCEHHWT